MTDRATLLALAERCEQAAGPDRELDIAIASGVGWPDGRYSPPLLPFSRARPPRHYTSSLDAAVTLGPKDWAWCVHDVGIASFMRASVVSKATSATPALALCAAALRARASIA